jgi:hypothetical protein
MYTALHPTRAENSTTPLRMPAISQQVVQFSVASHLTFSRTFFSYAENRGGKKEVGTLKMFATVLRSVLGLIVVIRHELGLNRHVSASSYSLFKGLPN